MKIVRTDRVHKNFRPQQHQFLDWVEKHLPSTSALGGELKTGTGKTAIMRALQLSFPASTIDVLSYSNQLVDDYSNTYQVNSVKGRVHYPSVEEWRAPRKLALKGCDTIFNPYSWIYFSDQIGGRRPDIIVFDEAHKILEMIHSFSTLSVKISSLSLKRQLMGKRPSDFEVQDFLKHEENNYSFDCPESQFTAMQIKKIRLDLYNHPEFYSVSVRSNKRKYFLDVQPLHTPIHLMRELFPAKKYIAISATMPQALFSEMFPKGKYLGLPHPVNSKKRPVIPYSVHENDRRNFDVLAPLIDMIISKSGKPNTIIHCTYADAKTLSKKLSVPCISYTKSNKQEAIKLFKEQGGVLLGAGIAEGVSFPDSECQLQIIPVLPYASLHDDYVKSRKSCANGQEWYNMSTMMTLWQMVGRGCRHTHDFCCTYVLDPYFGILFEKTKHQFDPSLTSSVVWDHTKLGALAQ